MNCKCVEILTAEHKIMLRMADVLDSMSTRASNEGTYNQEDVHAILNILRVFGDDCHQVKEEGALFPVFAAVCDPSEYAAVRHMLFEHEQDRSLIEGMEDAVHRSNAANSLSMPNDSRPFSETTFIRKTTFCLKK
jgi:hemerythrin-like domain-containing protein